MVAVNGIMLNKYKSLVTLGKGIYKCNCNQSMKYVEYEVVPVNDIMLKKNLGKRSI